MVEPSKTVQISSALSKVAQALNELYDLGERVDIRFGSVMTDYGYVLCDDDGRWSSKMKAGEPPAWWRTLSPMAADDE